MLDTTIMLAATSAMLAVTAATPPTPNAPFIASIFAGLFGGLIVQGWTYEARRPTKPVMISDVGASVFSGLIANTIGIKGCVAILNWLVPGEQAVLEFETTDHLGATLVVAGMAGMVGAGLLRKMMDRINPQWMNGDGKPK